MFKSLKLKTISLIITVVGIFIMSWLILNRGGISLIEKPLSAIGNLPSNYLIFLFGSGLVFYFVLIFFLKIHFIKNKRIGWELYVFPVLILSTLLIPYKEGLFVARVLHTSTGVLSALILVVTMYRINRFYFPRNVLLKKILRIIPVLTFFGTLIIFFVSGLNAFMQLFYLLLSLIWIDMIAFFK